MSFFLWDDFFLLSSLVLPLKCSILNLSSAISAFKCLSTNWLILNSVCVTLGFFNFHIILSLHMTGRWLLLQLALGYVLECTPVLLGNVSASCMSLSLLGFPCPQASWVFLSIHYYLIIYCIILFCFCFSLFSCNFH